ncbi:MAG: hypothetical protein OEV40_28560 [Acidimicrobiia bacterium]|nr:hypothetical protein [Acidimicrobiia bacterium]
MSSVLSHMFRLSIARLGLLLVSGDKRDAEILALRHQILVLQRQVQQPMFTTTDRTILAVFSRAFERQGPASVMLIVKPATVIGWHRRLVVRQQPDPPANPNPERNRQLQRARRATLSPTPPPDKPTNGPDEFSAPSGLPPPVTVAP